MSEFWVRLSGYLLIHHLSLGLQVIWNLSHLLQFLYLHFLISKLIFFFHGLLFCFYYAYFCVSMSCFIFMVLTPYVLWKIPTKLILKLFSHHPIIFNLCLMNLSPDCWFCCCFLKSFLSVILFCRLILTGIITSPLQTTSLYTDFVVAPNSWPCSASVHNRAYIGDAEFQSCSILSSYVTLVAWPRS